jgi:hypothetical protein
MESLYLDWHRNCGTQTTSYIIYCLDYFHGHTLLKFSCLRHLTYYRQTYFSEMFQLSYKIQQFTSFLILIGLIHTLTEYSSLLSYIIH